MSEPKAVGKEVERAVFGLLVDRVPSVLCAIAIDYLRHPGTEAANDRTTHSCTMRRIYWISFACCCLFVRLFVCLLVCVFVRAGNEWDSGTEWSNPFVSLSADRRTATVCLDRFLGRIIHTAQAGVCARHCLAEFPLPRSWSISVTAEADSSVFAGLLDKSSQCELDWKRYSDFSPHHTFYLHVSGRRHYDGFVSVCWGSSTADQKFRVSPGVLERFLDKTSGLRTVHFTFSENPANNSIDICINDHPLVIGNKPKFRPMFCHTQLEDGTWYPMAAVDTCLQQSWNSQITISSPPFIDVRPQTLAQ